MLSRSGSTIAKCVRLSKVASRAFAPAQPAVARFCFSTLVEQKGLGEEAKYIKEMELKRKEELQANLEKIMAQADSNEDVKAQLQSILGVNLILLCTQKALNYCYCYFSLLLLFRWKDGR